MLDADQLHAFRVFAEHRNLTRAARELHLSQPALHAKIARLADSVGVPLYRREGRALVLTRHGLALLAHARDAEDRDRAFLARLAGRSTRTLVLAAGEGALLYLLGPVLQGWAREGAALRVLVKDGPGAVDAVVTGHAHVGISAGDVAPVGVEATPLVDVGAVVVLPADHALARRPSLTPGDLAGARLVVPPPGARHREALERVLRRAGTPWEVGVEATGWPVLLHLASLGLGFAVVNACCTPPPGMAAVPFPALGAVRYWRVRGPGRAADDVAALEAALDAGVVRPS